MNAKTRRILKEARPLFWPWCAVTIAGALPHIRPLQSKEIAEIGTCGFLTGMLLLVSLSLGNEFQHRTLSLLLSQPVSRMKIWGEKLSVMAVAVLLAALVFFFGWPGAAPWLNLQNSVFAGAWLIATVASATFWTLLARSTLGGAALNWAVPTFLIFAWPNVFADWDNRTLHLSPATLTVVSIAAFCYAGVMLWLGGRKLARFQVTGGMAGDDLLMAGPSVMPGALAGWFRCRPTGPFLNLIRKELRLLRPVWLITLLSFLGWTWVTVLRLVPEHGFLRLIQPHESGIRVSLLFRVGLAGLLSYAIAIFAGSLSLGEERTSGTHSWHMTLPVSARRQWLIKLVMAMLTGLVCAALLPVVVLIAGGFLFGSPLMFVDPHGVMVWLVGMPLLTFASFWCACAVNRTVRAALWVVPAMGALFLASGCGDWVAGQLAQTTGTLVDLVVSWFRISPFNDFPYGTKITWVLVPTFLFALIQSYRLFRRQPEDGLRSMIRCLLPLAVVAFLCSFSLGASGFGFQPLRWDPFSETYSAIEKLQPGVTKLDAAHPLELTVEDLAKASPLSALTRRWLRDSSITVAPDQAHSGYFATIHLASGSDCRLAVRHYGGRSSYSERPSCVRRSP